MNDQTQENGDRRIAQLEQRIVELTQTVQQQIAELSQGIQLQRGADLHQSILDLREQIQALQQDRRPPEQVADQRTTLSYQQASEWVRMCNTITWSLGSIYVVAAILALNGAMQQSSMVWRSVVGALVVLLVVAWALIDWSYLQSASSARKHLREIETGWRGQEPIGGGFFTRQEQRHKFAFELVRFVLGASAALLFVGQSFGSRAVAPDGRPLGGSRRRAPKLPFKHSWHPTTAL
jgi:hypothetical protein